MSEHFFQTPHVVALPQIRELPGRDTFNDYPEETVDKEDLAALPVALLGATQGAYKYYARDNPAVVAWAALATGIVAYDTWAIATDHETMSHAYHRGMEHPILRFAFIGAIGAVALHLGHKT